MTFSADNLAHVAPLIRGRRYVIADNDQSGTGQRVAEATGLPWAMSDRVGNDANDDHRQFGLMAVCKLMMRAERARAWRPAGILARRRVTTGRALTVATVGRV